jgi:invasion protein IalB
MRASQWILIAAAGGLLVSGVAALLGIRGVADIEVAATGVKPNPPLVQEAQLRGAAPAAPAPAAPGRPQRVETTMYGSWAVTCEDTTAGGAVKRSCMASLRVTDRNRTLLNWQIGFNPEGRLVTAAHIPTGLAVKQGDKTVSGPILIAHGVELKFGNAPVRRLSFVFCGPRQCMAEAPIDDAFMKEAAASSKATITVHTAGGAIPFDLPIKGIDKAISSARK